MAVAARECWNRLSRARRWWRPVVREQRRAILPGIVDGSVQLCLELTEPDAGSNLIAISSTARRDGADLLLRGQTGGENADWMID
jgi:acyl-CoA dehydrogenase